MINIIVWILDFWPTSQPTNTQLSLSRAGASAVTGGAQHVAGPLAGAQGAPVVPQGTLQQPTQQAQALPPMGISLSQTGKSIKPCDFRYFNLFTRTIKLKRAG